MQHPWPAELFTKPSALPPEDEGEGGGVPGGSSADLDVTTKKSAFFYGEGFRVLAFWGFGGGPGVGVVGGCWVLLSHASHHYACAVWRVLCGM